ncbi:photosystem II protein Psb27 [Fortiea sp. LEGE XX443]|uniref:photosystem II protein Psb27 n=1 Tax=Fortiea sp. LEGE XX443 TaxID=1828611 RepID=UPI00187F00CE|nr:photosystem II protein Psb27 [Fortiea sp. LEGE XX443]MBE9008161.1 photosystem II protein Psb27 [Fortiea sp. LEGE XX443]
MLYSCCSLSAVYYLFTAYTERVFLPPLRLLKQPLRQALEVSDKSPERAALQAEARQKINDFSARYQRAGSISSLSSFTTMRTALNSLAGHYSSYPNRPVPEKLKSRLEQEFQQVESALKRGA